MNEKMTKEQFKQYMELKLTIGNALNGTNLQIGLALIHAFSIDLLKMALNKDIYNEKACFELIDELTKETKSQIKEYMESK